LGNQHRLFSCIIVELPRVHKFSIQVLEVRIRLSNMDQHGLALEESSQIWIGIQIDQICRVGQFHQQAPLQLEKAIRRAPTHRKVNIGLWSEAMLGDGTKDLNLPTAAALQDIHPTGHVLSEVIR
jgi:hypothetical protein